MNTTDTHGSVIIWSGAWVLCLITFVSLGLVVSNRSAPGIDLDFARQVQRLPAAAGDLLSVANFLGGGWPLGVVTAVTTGMFVLKGHRAEAALLAGTAIPRLLQEVAKAAFDAPRPAIDMLTVREFPGTAAYPSGHVNGTTVVYGLLFVLAPVITSNRNLVYAVRAVCIAMVISIPFARIWNGVHWPSDCIGGYLFAALWLIPFVAWYGAYRRKKAVVP